MRNCALVGALIVAIPWGIILLISRSPDLKMLGAFAVIAAAGALGGAIFWFIAVGGSQRAVA